MAVGRLPDDRERATCRRFLGAYDRSGDDSGPAAPDPVTAWSDLAHVLVNTKEFLYRR